MTSLITGCEGEVTPQPETCNLQDDDCNGVVDDVPQILDAGVLGYCTSPACTNEAADAAITCFVGDRPGICGAGHLECSTNNTVKCEAFVTMGAPEVCNGVDDDCNGQVDDGIPDLGNCETDSGVGECRNGKLSCANGIEACLPAMPSAETCDGKDNDCNGKRDDKTCTQGNAIYCCQNANSTWGCTATPNDGTKKNCVVGL